MTTRNEQSHPQRRRLAISATAVLTLLTVLAVAAVGLFSDARDPVSVPAAGPSTSRTTSSAPSASGAADPAAELERIAAHLASGPPDPVRAKFEYIETRVWESYPAPPSAPLGSGPGRHIRFWTTSLGVSRTIVIDEARGCPPESDQSDDDLGPFDGPLSSDPDAVRRQILHEPLPADAVPDVFGQVGEFYSARFVPLATRQGVLRMLARLPGVGVQRNVTDTLGRPGFAVTWTYRPPMPFTVAKTLIFSTSGQLLTVHSRAHRRPDASFPPDPMDEYQIYTVILTSTYTPDTATPKATCP
jgi:hypothetical protein